MKSTDDQGLIPVIVASEADSIYIRTIPTSQATTGDGSVSLDLGLPPECATSVAAGGKRPEMKDMNGIWNLFSRAIQSLQAYRGVYDAAFAAAIGGYPKYAMVSDSSGNFWVSTADQNTTVPGADGTSWRSLFDGYATQDQADARYLLLSKTSIQTVTGPVTFSGKTLVQNVDDFTSQEAIPAAQADGRYAHDGAVFTIGDNTNTLNSNILYGNSYRLSFQDDENLVLYDTSSNSVIFQLSKDSISWKGNALALEGDLNTETTNRTNADTNLQNQINNRVLKTGDTIDWLRVSGAFWVLGNQSAVYNGGVNRWTNSWVDNSGSATWDLNGGSPSNNTGNINWFRLDTDGSLRTGKGNVAFKSELSTAGTITGGTYTKTPMNDGTGRSVLVQRFSVSAADHAIISFPMQFSTTDGLTLSLTPQFKDSDTTTNVANFYENTITTSSFELDLRYLQNSYSSGRKAAQIIHVTAAGIIS